MRGPRLVAALGASLLLLSGCVTFELRPRIVLPDISIGARREAGVAATRARRAPAAAVRPPARGWYHRSRVEGHPRP